MIFKNQGFTRTDRSILSLWIWTIDRWLLATVFLLILIGIGLSLSTSASAAARIGLSDPYHFAIRQAIYGIISAFVVIGVSLLSPKGARRLCLVIYIVSVAMMMILPLFSHAAKGAVRWFQIGGFSLQPSEFMKPALIVLVAWLFSISHDIVSWPTVPLAFGLYGFATLLLLLQPDFGQALLITTAVGITFFITGVPLRWTILLSATAMLILAVVSLSSSHVHGRLHKFFSPDKTETYQIDKAKAAIASGGLLGRGPGEGLLKHQVPDVHTDFIYSGAAEEYGLIFSLSLIGLFTFLILHGLGLALNLTDPFEQIASAGLFILIGQQIAINIAVNLNVIPTKGMTLPFISYGGSSMLAMGLTLGLTLSLTRRRPGGYIRTNHAIPD